jgi:hypothetical protein
MSFQSNQVSYSKEFVGSLPGHADPVPVRIYTNLRIMRNEAARELKHRPAGGAPTYVFHRDENLPMHPSLLAMGGHYFTW